MALRIWAPLNGDLRQIGASNAILTNDGATIDNSGKIGKCYAFANTHIIIDSTDVQDFFSSPSQPFSMACWIYLNSDETDRVIIFGNYNANPFINWELAANCVQRLCVGGTSNYTTKGGGGAVPKTTWTHIAVTYDGNNTTFYQNGTQTYTATGANTLSTKTPSARFYLGSDVRNDATRLKGKMNDFRLYDHCLSAAEIREIAQGLVLHYKLSETNIESTINYVPSPYKDSYASISPGWDASKHPNAIQPQNWASGYNSGVSAPATGYHAMWNIIESIPTIVFQNHNSEVGKTGRWMGVSSSSLSFSIPANTKYTISYEQRTIDTLGGYTTSGVYYKYNSSIGTNFHDGCPKIGQNTVLNTWERFSYTFTRNSNVDGTGTNGTIYIYGHYGTESTMQIRNIQLEIKDHATAYTISSRNNADVQDSSGYSHNGTIIGDLILGENHGRYSSSLRWNSSSPTTNNTTGLCYIQAPITLTAPSQMSVTWWAKPENGYGGSTNHAAFCTSNNASKPSDYNSTAFHHRDAGFDIYPSDASGVKRLSFTYTQGSWHYYAITYDGTTAYSYQDGNLKSSVAVGTNKTLATFTQIYIGFSNAGGVTRKTLGNYSDFRIYCTALDAEAIRQLYEVGAKIDNKQNLHTFELVEPATKISINKQGQILCNELEETTTTKFFKTDQIIETNNLIEL